MRYFIIFVFRERIIPQRKVASFICDIYERVFIPPRFFLLAAKIAKELTNKKHLLFG